MPKGKITETQAVMYPLTQPMLCGNCGRKVPTPKGADADGVIVICGGCGYEIEPIPF